MNIKERFWNPIPAPGNKLADYALALLAEASYQEDATSLTMWARIFDMPIYGVIITPGILIPNFVIAGHGDRLVVGVPGTMNFAQMMENILYSAQRENADYGPGRMHSFFLWCAEGIVSFVRDRLALFTELREITFVGHSLGGAVAQLLADWVTQNTSIQVKYCVTYNSPRVGNPFWARRTRPYKTVNYYSTRDMVCEVPPVYNPSTSAYQTDFGFIDAYVHRGETTPDGTPTPQDALVPVKSTRDLRETWIAAVGGKIGLVGGNVGARAFVAETAKTVFENLARISGRVYAASWFLPLPIWLDEHRMFTMVQNFEAAIVGQSFPERRQLKDLHDFLGALEPPISFVSSSPYNSASFPYAIVPPASFEQGAYPGGGTIDGVPIPSPGTRTETLEASFEWQVSSEERPMRELAYVDDAFFAAFARADTGPLGTSPLTVPGPIAVDLPPRPHWAMRGDDRRILQKILKCIALMESQEWRRLDPTEATGISTRDPAFDLLDDELQAAIETVRDRCSLLLGLMIEED